MRIDPTETAIERLNHSLPIDGSLLKIAYDIEGCGCAVDGVVQLWLVGERLPEDRTAYDGRVKFIYDHRQEVFFEDIIKLDYNEKNCCFTLRSNSQIYNTALQIINKIGG